jgi:hypothetical protein
MVYFPTFWLFLVGRLGLRISQVKLVSGPVGIWEPGRNTTARTGGRMVMWVSEGVGGLWVSLRVAREQDNEEDEGYGEEKGGLCLATHD